MAQYYQEVDYCSEEVTSGAVAASPAAAARRGGVQQHVVKETFIQEAADRSGHRGRHGHGHGHRGHGHLGVRESRVEEDFNSCTGEFHERRESFAVRADD